MCVSYDVWVVGVWGPNLYDGNTFPFGLTIA